MKKRVLLAGLFHETHTFLEGTTTLDDFAIRRGDELFAAADDGSPLSGALEVASSYAWDVRPVVDLRTTPSATVDDAVYEFFWQQFESAWRTEQRRPDGIFLVLHGAMVCQSIRDVEGDLIERIRPLPGAADVPICGVLDLHGNISRRTIEAVTGFSCVSHESAHRCRQAAMDAATLLDRILTTGRKPTVLFESVPSCGRRPGPARMTNRCAGSKRWRETSNERAEIAAVNVMAGFSFADTFDTGVSFSAVTFGDPEPARRHLRSLCDFAVRHREAGNVHRAAARNVMPNVLDCVARGQTPVALVEPADNVGGGAPGDAPTILRALVETSRRAGGRRHQ